MREWETARLKLRQVHAEDAQQIFEGWASREEVTRYLTWNPHSSVEVTKRVLAGWLKAYDEPDCLRWGIELRETGELIGMIDVVGYHHGRPVIGYCSAPAHWNKGYMTEALRAVTEELFRLGHEEIVIEAVKENIGSNRVIQKAGFEQVASRCEALSAIKPEQVTIHSYRLRRG